MDFLRILHDFQNILSKINNKVVYNPSCELVYNPIKYSCIY